LVAQLKLEFKYVSKYFLFADDILIVWTTIDGLVYNVVLFRKGEYCDL